MPPAKKRKKTAVKKTAVAMDSQLQKAASAALATFAEHLFNGDGQRLVASRSTGRRAGLKASGVLSNGVKFGVNISQRG